MIERHTVRWTAACLGLLVLLVVLAGIAGAGTGDRALHPDEQEGVIAAFEEEQGHVRIIVQTAEGALVPVLGKSTTRTYLNGQRVKIDDLKVGDRVFVEYLPGPRIALELKATRPVQ